MADALQLKSHFVGLLDALVKEGAVDTPLADAVAVILSSSELLSFAAFVTKVKSDFADFTIAEIAGGEKANMYFLEKTIARMESCLHVLTKLKARAEFRPQWNRSEPFKAWVLEARETINKFYAYESFEWSRRAEYSKLLALYVTPVIATHPELDGAIWNKMTLVKESVAAKSSAIKTPAPTAEAKGAPAAKQARNSDA